MENVLFTRTQVAASPGVMRADPTIVRTLPVLPTEGVGDAVAGLRDTLRDTDTEEVREGLGDTETEGEGLADGLTDGNTVKSKYTQLMLGWGTAAYVFENPVAHNTTVRLPAGLNTI